MVIDTSAMIAILLSQPEADRLVAALESDHTRLVSAATVVEACLFGMCVTRRARNSSGSTVSVPAVGPSRLSERYCTGAPGPSYSRRSIPQLVIPIPLPAQGRRSM